MISAARARRTPSAAIAAGAVPQTATASERPFDSTVHRVVSARSASVVDAVLDDLATFELDRGERDWRRRRECGLVLFVFGEWIGRLPRRQRERNLEDTSVDVGIAKVLAAQHTLVGGDRGERPRRQVRCQLRPRVRARRDLGQRSEREAPRSFGQHPRCPLSRRLEREAVLGQRRRRPQLLPPLECPAATVSELDEPVPIPCRAELIDRAYELVEITLLDDLR